MAYAILVIMYIYYTAHQPMKMCVTESCSHSERVNYTKCLWRRFPMQPINKCSWILRNVHQSYVRYEGKANALSRERAALGVTRTYDTLQSRRSALPP